MRSPGDRNDDNFDYLPPFGVVDTAGHDISDIGVCRDDCLDGLGPDVLTASDDQVALAAVNVQLAAVGPATEIAGVQPSVVGDG